MTDQKKVLVVDDDYTFAEFSQVLLDAIGCRAVLCLESENAEAMAAQEKPDLILMDIAMPGLSGVELIKRLKASPATSGIPILICSMTKSKSELHEAFALGALDFLHKPIDKNELKARVDQALRT